MGSDERLIERPRLLGKVGDSTAPLVLLIAPSGYGKSVLIGQWERASSRPFASLLLGPQHNDPALLVASILAALDPIEALPADIAKALDNPRPNLEKVVLPRLGRALGELRRPFVLVLDDFERIESPDCLAVVETIVANLGFSAITFPRPVFVGDTLRAETEVAAARASASRPGQGVVTFVHRGSNQHGELVCEATRLALMLSTAAGEARSHR